jgi:hypothetical protein
MMRAGRALLYGAALLWIAAAIGGSLYMFAYESQAAPPSALAQVWPERTGLARNPDGFSLVMAVHPKCPCTRASVAELNRLMQEWGGRVHAIALVTKPFELPDLWSETDVTARLREIPNVEVVRDLGGSKSDAFGARSSGQTLLYDASGRLVFDGGITAFRGHEGPSVGGEALKQLVAGAPAATLHSKVFGCSLKDKFCPARGTSGEGHDHGRDGNDV